MLKAQVLNASGQVVGEVELPAGVFSYPVNEHLLYESVVQYRANQRRGTASTKTRGEVSGSNRKPWRQKGTGRARAGSIRSPLWRKGGIIHGPKPRDYHYAMPKRARANALRSALSLKWSGERLLIVSDASVSEAKTKEAARWLKTLHLTSALIVDKNENTTLFRAIRNLPRVKAVDASELTSLDVLNHDWLVLTQRALESLGKRLSQ